MNIQLKTIEEVTTFIANANTLLGYPDGNGTETYCDVPEETVITGEDEEIIDTYYLLPLTSELSEAMIKIATERLLILQ